jgi:hypothetical protein
MKRQQKKAAERESKEARMRANIPGFALTSALYDTMLAWRKTASDLPDNKLTATLRCGVALFVLLLTDAMDDAEHEEFINVLRAGHNDSRGRAIVQGKERDMPIEDQQIAGNLEIADKAAHDMFAKHGCVGSALLLFKSDEVAVVENFCNWNNNDGRLARLLSAREMLAREADISHYAIVAVAWACVPPKDGAPPVRASSSLSGLTGATTPIAIEIAGLILPS